MPPPHKFSRALYDFEAFLEVEKNLSPQTRRAYVYDLEKFMDYWIARRKENPTIHKILTEDIRRYLEHLRMDRHYKSTTLSRTIASIRIFFEYCLREGLIEASPAAHIHNPKNPKKLPVFLVESETRRLMESPPKTDQETAEMRSDYRHLGVRDHAIITTLVFTGLRLQELVNMNLIDIDFERGNLRVMGKGAKERIVPMNRTVREAMEACLEKRDPAAPDEKAVFLNRFGQRLSKSGVEKMVEKYVLKSGIGKDGISPHKLRHTFATLLHVNGVDIVEIQALMGHATITSTQIYTHANTSRLKGAVEKLDSI
ncbi:tyrosine recombinase XerC [bacterium]|nr:tyrosine recombinase XerC [bacterium]